MTSTTNTPPTSKQTSDKLTAWFRSPEYKAAFDSPNPHHMNDVKLIALAQESTRSFGLLPSWSSPPTRFFSAHHNFVTTCSRSSKGSAERVKSCVDAGLDPWLVIHREHTDLGFKLKGHFQYQYFFGLIPPQYMAQHIVASPTIAASVSLGTIAASFAIGHGDEHALEFLKHLCDKVASEAGASLQGANGILGERDRAAKRCAQIFIALEKDLEPLATSPEAQKHLALAMTSARDLVETKSKAAAFDPAKYKKAISPEKRERLISIMGLAERSNVDDAAAAYLILGTPWLSDEPNALSIGIKSRACVLSHALTCGGTRTLDAIESLGANIWIASAQQGESNACLWGAYLISRLPPESACIGSLARMLAYGAHLDGAGDPVQYALDKLAAARKSHAPELILDRIKAELESIAFTQLLAEREVDAKERAEEAARPRRHRL